MTNIETAPMWMIIEGERIEEVKRNYIPGRVDRKGGANIEN